MSAVLSANSTTCLLFCIITFTSTTTSDVHNPSFMFCLNFPCFFDHVAIAFCLHITRPVLFGLQATVMSMHQVSIAHDFAQAAAASYIVKKAGGRSQASLKLPTATDMTKSHIYDTKIPYLLLSGIALLSSNLQ